MAPVNVSMGLMVTLTEILTATEMLTPMATLTAMPMAMLLATETLIPAVSGNVPVMGVADEVGPELSALGRPVAFGDGWMCMHIMSMLRFNPY